MSFFMPTAGAVRATEIAPSVFLEWGVRAVLLDVDNTLTRHNDPQPYAGTQAWVDDLRAAGLQVMIISNNKEERVAAFAALYRLPFCAMALKPLPVGYRKAARALQVPYRACAVVGDQIFTDIIGANLLGMKTVLLDPIEPESALSFRIRRRLEQPFRKKLKRRTAERRS